MKIGDLVVLVDDFVVCEMIIVDLLIVVWQLLCVDGDVIDVIGCLCLWQIVIGGEVICCSVVDKWFELVVL